MDWIFAHSYEIFPMMTYKDRIDFSITVPTMYTAVLHFMIVFTIPICFIPSELDSSDGQLQIDEISVAANVTAQHLKFTIPAGYDHFISVHHLQVNGTAVHW